jgi:glycosyltransferase involved in cell wall biosynthesis
MKIDYLTSVHLDEANAPAHHVLESCAALHGLGHSVRLLHPSANWLSPRRQDDVFPRISRFYPRVRGGARLYHLAVARLLRGSYGQHPPDVLYLRFAPSEPLVAALRTLAVPKVLEINGIKQLHKPVFHRLLSVVDLVLVDSEDLRERLCKVTGLIPDRSAVHVSPGVDAAHFRPMDLALCRDTLELPQDRIVLLHVSSFQPHHDFATLIAAFRRLVAQDRRYLLLLIGAGPRWNEVRAGVADLITKGQVIMPGMVSRERVPVFIGSADVCINLFTLEELQAGNLRAFKLYEYTACARPVVESIRRELAVAPWATACLGLVSAGSVADVVAAVQAVRAHPQEWQERAVAGRRHVEATRQWTHSAQSSMNAIGRLLDRGVPSAHGS